MERRDGGAKLASWSIAQDDVPHGASDDEDGGRGIQSLVAGDVLGDMLLLRRHPSEESDKLGRRGSGGAFWVVEGDDGGEMLH